MHIYEKDFRYLLLHLIPQHRLSAAMRRDVDHALRSDDDRQVRRSSVRALEELCTADYFERSAVRRDNGVVVVDYRRRGGLYQLSVSVPSTEWAGEPDEPVAVAPSHGTQAPSPDANEAAGEAIGYLPEIIRSFAITDRTDPVISRLEVLLGTLHEWLDLRGAWIDMLEDVVGRSDPVGNRVRIVTEDDLRASELSLSVIESGSRRLTPKASLDGDGAGSWSVLGLAPIFSMGKVAGVLQVHFSEGVDTQTMERRLELCANVVRQVVEFHQQIENMTSVDALTGVYNRHFYDVQLPVEIERAMRSGGVLSMLLIDVDDFKRINDELGHRKGDEALGVVADIIRSNLRKIDLPFRYGGEELVILLPGTSEFESVHTAERLRRVIGQHQGFRDLHGRPRAITVSVGVSVYPETAKTAEELFTQADAAMYRAKQLGKNRVVLYKESMDMGRL